MQDLHGKVVMQLFPLVSQSVVDKTLAYVENQSEHHKKRSFQEEYIDFLKLYNIEYDERYVFRD